VLGTHHIIFSLNVFSLELTNDPKSGFLGDANVRSSEATPAQPIR